MIRTEAQFGEQASHDGWSHCNDGYVAESSTS
jgi:hypothetical protein